MLNPDTARDAGIKKVTQTNWDEFQVMRTDNSTFTVRLVVGPVSDPAQVEVIAPGQVEVRVSSKADSVIVQRAVVSAIAQASAVLGNTQTDKNLLSRDTHPGGNTELSAQDHGRQAEVRHLDRARRETSRVRIMRRHRMASEMKALVEHLGLHPDDPVSPQRRAVSDVGGTIDLHVQEGDRRPAWALPPDGYPKWKAFLLYNLPADVLPGVAAGTAIAATGAPVVGAAIASSAVAAGVTGTLIKRWYGRADKTNTDTGHGINIKIRAHETALRRKALLNPLLERTRATNLTDPAEPAPDDTMPPMYQVYWKRLVAAGVPAFAGAGTATAFLAAGLPFWTAAAQLGAAVLATGAKPVAEWFFRKSLVSREWKLLDGIGRTNDETAAEFDVAFAEKLTALLDRIDNLAGVNPAAATPNAAPVKAADPNKTWIHRYLGGQSGQLNNMLNAGSDAITKREDAISKAGKLPAGSADQQNVLNAGINAAMDSLWTGAMRAGVGLLINAFLDQRFTNNEYKKILEQVEYDFGNKMVEQVELEHRILTLLLDALTAEVDTAEQAVNRVNTTLAERVKDVTVPAPPSPDTNERPAGHQGARAFATHHLLQGTTITGLMAGAVQFLNQDPTGLIVIGSVAAGIVASFPLRYLFRHAEQLAVDETIFADRNKERPVEEAEAAARQRFLLEFFTREIGVATGQVTPSTPPTRPADPDPNAPDFADQIDALVEYERETLRNEPRPWSTLGAKLVALARMDTLAQRVRDFHDHAVATGNGRPEQQAREDLNALREAYQELDKDEVARDEDKAMPPDYERQAEYDEQQRKAAAGLRGGEPAANPPSPRLQSYLDDSVVTPAGRAFYANGDELLGEAHDVPPVPGQYTIDMHGAEGSVRIGQDRLTAEDLATIIKADPNWHGEPIRLLACNTGLNPDGFAQQLADLLGVTVHAPDGYVQLDMATGELLVGEARVDSVGDLRLVIPPTGTMRTFTPRTTAVGEVVGAAVEPVSTTRLPVGDPQPDQSPMRPVRTAPGTMGTFAENRLTRDATGRITEIDGLPVEEKLRQLAETRVEQYWNAQRVEDPTRFEGPNATQRPSAAFDTDRRQQPDVRLNYEVTTDKHGNERIQNKNLTGNVMALAIDLVTGEVFEAVNGPATEPVHQKIQTRLTELTRPDGYVKMDGTGQPLANQHHHLPFDADPLSHAEVRAVNQGLHTRPDADFNDFVTDVQFMRGQGVKPAWYCPNCAGILHDVPTNAGKRVYDPSGYRYEPGHFGDDPQAPLRRPNRPPLLRGTPGPRSRVFGVQSLDHSRFEVSPKATVRTGLVKERAKAAMRAVAGDAKVRRTESLGVGTSRFTVTPIQGSDFEVEIVAGDVSPGNVAEIKVDPDTRKVVLKVSAQVELNLVERAVANAVAQADTALNGTPGDKNVLDGTRHPEDATKLSAEDHGRLAEVRNLDRARQGLKQRQLIRRRRIANEMKALVEHLGLHPDDEVAPQRQAVANVDDLIRENVEPGGKRPAWSTPPDGYPTWKAFLKYHLIAEMLGGWGAGGAVIVTGPDVIGAAILASTTANGVTGTLIKHWYDKRTKTNVDTGHGKNIEIRRYEQAKRRRELYGPLFTRLRGTDIPGRDEPAPDTTMPDTYQSYWSRLLARGGGPIAGAAAATPAYAFGLPGWVLAAHWGVAGFAATIGPWAEKRFNDRNTTREWGQLDDIGRRKDMSAAEFDEYFAAQLFALADRIDNIAGIAITGTTPAAPPVDPAEIVKNGVARYITNQSAGQSGDIARSGLDALGKAVSGTGKTQNALINTAVDSLLTGSTRAVLGTLINAFLDRRFLAKEYEAILDQVDFDFGNQVAEETTLEHQILNRMLDDLVAKVDEAERVAGTVNPDLAQALQELRDRTPSPLVLYDHGERPIGHQRMPAFAALHTSQGVTILGLMAGATWAFKQSPVGIWVIGAVGGGITSSFPLRYLFRRAGQVAVDETIFSDRVKQKIVQEAEAEAHLKFMVEHVTSVIEAAKSGQPRPYSTPPPPPMMPRPPFDHAAFPNYVDAMVEHERQLMHYDPTPLSLLDARLLGLDRLSALAQRVRDFAGTGRPLQQAQLDLNALWETYEALRDEGTAMPDDYQLLKPKGVRGGPPGTKPARKLRTYLDLSIATPAGRAFYAYHDELVAEVFNVPPVPGQYTIDMHGGPDVVSIGRDRLTPADLAALIRMDPNWRGEPIRLLACETGQRSDGFAQQLADQLGVTVWAPSDYTEITPDGELIVSTGKVDSSGRMRLVIPPTGKMYAFEPTVPGPAVRGSASPHQPPLLMGLQWPERAEVEFGEMHEVEPPKDLGELTLYLDGSPLYNGADRLWPDELAEIIAGNDEWAEGPTRLQVHDGQVDPEFVQRLADLLGVPVVVPVNDVGGEFATLSSGTLDVYNEPASTKLPPGCRIYEPRNVPAGKGNS